MLMLAVASSAVAGLIATAPSDCKAAFDPYAYTQAALQSCGYTIIPLTRTVPLSGGGTGYVYSNGAEQLIPPSGFNPLAATNAQLDEYGIPEQPTNDLNAAGLWQKEMENFHPIAAPPYYVSSPYQSFDTVYDINHAGYDAAPIDGGMPTHAEGWVTSPVSITVFAPRRRRCRGRDCKTAIVAISRRMGRRITCQALVITRLGTRSATRAPHQSQFLAFTGT